jgi:hypothetical protein
MMKAIPFYWFEREDYEQVRCLIPNDKQIPASFDQWEQGALKQISQLEARGIPIRKIMVDPQEYGAYCGVRGIAPSIATLGAFILEFLPARGR